jgi:hypothetical protein
MADQHDGQIPTQTKSFRLAVDVIELLERWAKETGQTVTAVLQTLVRTAAEDEDRIAETSKSADSVLQDGEAGGSVLQLRMPKNRDDLADAISVLMLETQLHIGERDQVSALGVARARVYKTTPEFQTALKHRQEIRIPGPYDDEKKLANELSERS